MKKILYSLLAAALMAGCSNVEEQVTPGNEPGNDFDVTACKIAPTRVGYTEDGGALTAQWEQTDLISIYADAGVNPNRGTLKFVSYKGSDKSNANFKGHFDRDVATTTPIYAYAQYPNVYNQADAIVNDLHFQTGKLTGEGSATTHDVLFATGTYDPNATEPLALTFQRKMAIVKFDMTLPDEVTTKPTSVSIMGAGVYNNVSLNIADATLKTGE